MTSGKERLGIGVIGSGSMGSFHAETVTRRIPDADLVAIADPAPGIAARLVDTLGARRSFLEAAELIGDDEVEAVVIAAPARHHTELVVAAAEAGKHVFCEKPMAVTLSEADRAIEAAHRNRVVLQVGFQRRFAAGWEAAREHIDAGRVGTPRQLRSVTRDPGFDPSRVPPNTIFLETLIHDFDTLRFLNPGAAAVSVYALADAIVEPDWREHGLLDTAVAVVRFDNGATGVVEACFEASYGYDVRAEVFGSAGMVTMGDGRRSDASYSGLDGRTVDTARSFLELFHDAYRAELAAFVEAAASLAPPMVSGEDARAALAMALSAIQSHETGLPVSVVAGAQ